MFEGKISSDKNDQSYEINFDEDFINIERSEQTVYDKNGEAST